MTAAATTATQQRNGNKMATVMEGNGRCGGNVTATTAMEGARAMQRQRNGDGWRGSNCNKWSYSNRMAMTEMDSAGVTATVMAMDSTRATAMEGAMATRWQQQRWKAQRGRNCGNGNGDGRGDGNGNERRDGNATAKTAMDSARATSINRGAATQQQRNVQWQRGGNGRPVVVADIKIEEEEIARKYDKDALPLIVMALLLHAHLLV